MRPTNQRNNRLNSQNLRAASSSCRATVVALPHSLNSKRRFSFWCHILARTSRCTGGRAETEGAFRLVGWPSYPRDRGFGPGCCQQQRDSRRCPPEIRRLTQRASSHDELEGGASTARPRLCRAGGFQISVTLDRKMAGTRQSELFPSRPSPTTATTRARSRRRDPSANRAIDARELDVDQIEELIRSSATGARPRIKPTNGRRVRPRPRR